MHFIPLFIPQNLSQKIQIEITSNFEENRKIGENDNYISKLIQNDSVEEFISYINKTNISLISYIQPSIFETHSFLLKNKPTLIEYAAFFGSIQIFQFLRFNKVNLESIHFDLTPSLWYYSIHGKNADIIHILEENHIEPKYNSFQDCFEEAIKCHHNDIANYFLNNFLPNQKENNIDVYIQYLKNYNFLFILIS